MSKIVSKFGGSSLADASQIRKVLDILAADADRRFLVVSAPGKRSDRDRKITDMLYEVYRLAEAGGPWEELLREIEGRYRVIAESLAADWDPGEEFEEIRRRTAE